MRGGELKKEGKPPCLHDLAKALHMWVVKASLLTSSLSLSTHSSRSPTEVCMQSTAVTTIQLSYCFTTKKRKKNSNNNFR